MRVDNITRLNTTQQQPVSFRDLSRESTRICWPLFSKFSASCRSRCSCSIANIVVTKCLAASSMLVLSFADVSNLVSN